MSHNNRENCNLRLIINKIWLNVKEINHRIVDRRTDGEALIILVIRTEIRNILK